MMLTSPPVRLVERFAGRLRFPALFMLTAAVFLLDLVFPDAIPLVDEILLGLATVLLGTWKRRRRPGEREDDGTRRGDEDGRDGVETTGPRA